MNELQSLTDLLDLQVIDLDIDRLLHRRESLPELESYKAAHEETERIAAEHGAAAGRLRETTLNLDKSDGELELSSQKLESEQMRLYAGGIGAREADHLRQEVEMLGRKKATLEDQVLELMESREEQEQSVAELTAQLERSKADEARLERIITDAWQKIDAEIARKEVRKGDIVPLISGDVLELYEELRRTKEGVAVGRLAEGICGGCHLRLTVGEQKLALESDPPRCIHCRRILVP